MLLSSRVRLASPGLTVFNTIDRESQSTAAALSVKAASDPQVRFFLAMLDAWGRSDVKVLLRSDHEVTFTLILREVQARRQQRISVERSPVESHATMGAMERASRTLGEMLRTMIRNYTVTNRCFSGPPRESQQRWFFSVETSPSFRFRFVKNEFHQSNHVHFVPPQTRNSTFHGILKGCVLMFC